MDEMKQNKNENIPAASAAIANAAPVNAPAPASAQTDMAMKKSKLQNALKQVNAPVEKAAPVQKPQSGAPATSNEAVLNNELQKQSVQTSAEVLQQTLNEAQPQSQPNPNAIQVGYVDPNGQQQVGYIIDGTTYTDPAGANPVPVGSTVTDEYGRQWYKGEKGSTEVNGGHAPSQVSYINPNGQQQTGYLIGGVTYLDKEGTTPIPVGSTVTTPDGKRWYKGENGSYAISEIEYQRNLSDLSALINQQFDAADEAVKVGTNYATQTAVDQLNRAMQDAQPSYEAAIANQLLETKQAQDAQALRNQVNGDRGGIGSAQVDSIGNTGARNREAIAAQQRQLASDTARQIADLRAQGKYQEANALLQSAQQRLSALYNEQVRLQQEYTVKQTQLASLGSTYMNAGIMPTDEMLAAMGINRATAQLYLNKLAESSGGGSGGYGGNAGSGDGGVTPKNTFGYNNLSESAKKIANQFRTVDLDVNVGANAEIIAKAVSEGTISDAEAKFLRDAVGISTSDKEWDAALKKYMDEENP